MKKIIWEKTTQEHSRCIYRVYMLPFTSSVSIYTKSYNNLVNNTTKYRFSTPYQVENSLSKYSEFNRHVKFLMHLSEMSPGYEKIGGTNTPM